MNIQDKINLVKTGSNYSITSKEKATAISYNAIINSLDNNQSKDNNYYDIKKVDSVDESFSIDLESFLDQSRMNSLAQYEKYVDARDNGSNKVKVLVR